jgi:hypothetical protein
MPSSRSFAPPSHRHCDTYLGLQITDSASSVTNNIHPAAIARNPNANARVTIPSSKLNQALQLSSQLQLLVHHKVLSWPRPTLTAINHRCFKLDMVDQEWVMIQPSLLALPLRAVNNMSSPLPSIPRWKLWHLLLQLHQTIPSPIHSQV